MSTRDYPSGGGGGRCIGLRALRPSYADCLKILGASTSCTPMGLSRVALPSPLQGVVTGHTWPEWREASVTWTVKWNFHFRLSGITDRTSCFEAEILAPSYRLHSNRCRDTEPTRAPDEVQWIWGACPSATLSKERWSCDAKRWAPPRATSSCTWMAMNAKSRSPPCVIPKMAKWDLGRYSQSNERQHQAWLIPRTLQMTTWHPRRPARYFRYLTDD